MKWTTILKTAAACCIAVSLTVGSGVALGEQDVLTLDEAYEEALQASTVIASSKLAVEQAELAEDQARETAAAIDKKSVMTWALILAKHYAPVSSLSNLEMARLSHELTQKSLRLSVSEAYYGVLKARAMLSAQEAGLTRAEEQLKTAKAMFDAGMVAKTDVLAAEVGVSGARVAVASASKAVKMANMGLNRLLGRDLDAEVRPSAGFEYRAPEPVDLSEVVASAMAKRLDVKKASEGVRLAELHLSLAGTHFSTNVWDARQAALNVESAKLGLELAKQSAEYEIRLAYEGLLEADERYHLTQKTVEQAQESLRLARLRYDAGVGTSLEVTTADSTLREVQAQAIQAEFDYALSAAKFEFVREGGQLP